MVWVTQPTRITVSVSEQHTATHQLLSCNYTGSSELELLENSYITTTTNTTTTTRRSSMTRNTHPGIKGTTNPLLVDLVLERIFSSLSIRQIKACREVCSIWANTGYHALLPRCKNTVLFGDCTRSKDMEKFTKSLPYIYKIPYTSFSIQPSIFALKRSQPLEEFFFQSAHLMQALSLSYSDNSHIKTCFTKDFLKHLQLPHLSHLRFEVLSDSFGNIENNSLSSSVLGAQELFRSLFLSAENLVRLELVISGDDSRGSNPYIHIIGSSSQHIHRRLKELVLNVPLTPKDCGDLVNLDYNFHALQIKFCRGFPKNLDKSPLTFLESQSCSLKKLKFNPWKTYSSNEGIEKFPTMTYLEELEVLDWKIASDSNSCLPFHFTYEFTFPQLKKLSFQCHKWQNYFLKFFPANRVANTIRELKLPKSIGVDYSLLVERVSNVFPNLAKIEIAVSSESIESLSDLFRLIPNLEDLSVSFVNWVGSKCIDYILTGISESDCKKIYSYQDIASVNLSHIYTRPSLMSLKGLRRLQLRNMSMFSHKGRPQYTDITGYHGILNLKRLSSLSIWRSQISDECLNDLRKRFNVTLHTY